MKHIQRALHYKYICTDSYSYIYYVYSIVFRKMVGQEEFGNENFDIKV